MGVFSNLPSLSSSDVVSSSPCLRGRPVAETMFMLSANETTNYAGFQQEASDEDDDDVKLDFVVAGFPKCGTTTLLKTFDQHEGEIAWRDDKLSSMHGLILFHQSNSLFPFSYTETQVHPVEECSLDQVFQDDYAYTRLTENLKALNGTRSTKRGIKCPFVFTTPKSLERLEDWFPSTKVIFGLRHPVHFFQSYYNYRVMDVHLGKLEGPIPSAESLIGSNDWIRVSTDYARYEEVLMKLGKTKASQEPKSPFKIFLYTLEQMEDEDDARRAKLREALGDFLNLEKKIEPLTAVNVNKLVGKKGFDETIDICDSKHDELRGVLVENGKKTQKWILEEFLESPDVNIANEDHFRDIVSQWGTDPCLDREDASDESDERSQSEEEEEVENDSQPEEE